MTKVLPVIQAMARATCLSFYGTEWSNTSEFRQGICIEIAIASLEAIRAEGYVVAKVEVGDMIVRNPNLVGVTVSDIQ